ncbi:MAG: hypothetical protein JWN96_1987, partial [Mycobacterium sp.]|nr:hypothetical protein [Mycobacterium sp.]
AHFWSVLAGDGRTNAPKPKGAQGLPLAGGAPNS